MATKSGWTVEVMSGAAQKEMQAQPESIQADFFRVSQMIEDVGPYKIPRHYRKKIEDDIWEIRLKGRDTIARALYLKWVGMRVIVVHVFTKKKQHIDRRHIELARKRARELEYD